jgi:hypothetical protein
VLAAGVAGAVLGLAGGRAVGAGTTPPTEPPAPPTRPTAADLVLLQFAMSAEMTATDLYQAAADAGAEDQLVTVLRDNHRAYADILRAILGTSVIDRRNEALFDELAPSFEESDITTLAATAYDFESTLVATHTESLRSIENIDAARRVAAILIVEARHCTVLADAAGQGDDLDALFVNDADPLPAGQVTGG